MRRCERLPLQGPQSVGAKGLLAHSRAEQLQFISGEKTIAPLDPEPVRSAAHQSDKIMGADIMGILRIHHGILRGEEKPGTIGTMTDLFQFLAPARVEIRGIGAEPVDGIPIDPGGGGDIIETLHAPLHLETVDSQIDQGGKMLDQTEVATVHQISAPRILLDVQTLLRATFFHQSVIPATGLSAIPAIGAALEQRRGQQAATGMRHAHRPVDKTFQLHGTLPGTGAQILQGQFPGQVDPAGAIGAPELQRPGITAVDLGRDMHRPLRIDPANGQQYPRIGDDIGIRSERSEFLEQGFQSREFRRSQGGVEGQIERDTRSAGQLPGPAQLVQIEVPGMGAQPEIPGSQIHGIRAEAHGDLQLFQIPRGDQQFGFFSVGQGFHTGVLHSQGHRLREHSIDNRSRAAREKHSPSRAASARLAAHQEKILTANL